MNDRTARLLALSALLGAAALPAPGRAGELLDVALVVHEEPAPDLRVALLADKPKPPLDFDLLGEAKKPAAPAEDPSLKTRRKMLNLHQGLGLGLLGLQVVTTVTGQLNYNDKFGTANTDKYKLTHQVVAYADLAAFAVVGGIALFAPTEKNAPKAPFGRTTVHKIGMALATAGMITQGVLGVQTVNREGYLDQQKYGRAHLAVGYATLAVMCVAVGVLVF